MTEQIQVPGVDPETPGLIDPADFTALLQLYGAGTDSVRHLGSSENATFSIETARSGEAVLRIYRVGHRSLAAIHSEIAWMEALRHEAGISTPAILSAADGAPVSQVRTSAGATYCVAFQKLPGSEPPESQLTQWFGKLGALCARLHEHAAKWRAPVNFARPGLDWSTLIGPKAIWGSWNRAPGLRTADRPLLERVCERLRLRMEQYGTATNRYGLIHGDLRLQNILVDNEHVHLIDFDDCGMCWYLYDLATALSLVEDLPVAGELLDSWITGYTQLRPLRPQDLDIIPDLIMMRRLQVLGWFGSRHNSEVARTWAPGYVPACVAAAADFLAGRPRLEPGVSHSTSTGPAIPPPGRGE